MAGENTSKLKIVLKPHLHNVIFSTVSVTLSKKKIQKILYQKRKLQQQPRTRRSNKYPLGERK